MTTAGQLWLIGELLKELGWTKDDIAGEIGEEFRDYEALSSREASELISYLTEHKRERKRERRG